MACRAAGRYRGGIGDAAEFTWQLEGTVGLRITRWLTGFVGCRALYYDLVEDDGAMRNGTELTQHGPILWAGVSFLPVNLHIRCDEEGRCRRKTG